MSDDTTPGELLRQARKLRVGKDFVGALDILGRIPRDGISDDVRLETALVHLASESYPLAEPILRDLHARAPDDARVCSALARVEGARGDCRSAVSLLRTALANAPPSADRRRALARHLLALGEHDEALREVEHALADSKGSGRVEAHRVAYSVHVDLQDWEAAEDALRAILEIDPRDVKALRAKVEIAFRRRDHRAVLKRARRAAALLPNDPRLGAMVASSRQLRHTSYHEQAPQLVMLNSIPPWNKFNGGRYFQSVIDLYPSDRLAIFCVHPIDLIVSAPEEHAHLPLVFAAHPVNRRTARRGVEDNPAYAAMWKTALATAAGEIAAEVAEFARRRGAQTVLIPLIDPLLFRIARILCEKSLLRLAVLVMDPPDLLLKTRQVPIEFHEELALDFDHVLSNAERCGSISEGMADLYERAYGQPPLLLRHALADELGRPGRRVLLHDDRFVIAMVGSFFADDAVAAFIKALQEADWIIAGRSASLICLTLHPPPGATDSMPIKHLGWLDQDAAVAALSEADVGYVPYWFDEEYTTTVQQAFPSKLSTFAAAGLPVLFHGPAHSSVIAFLEGRPMGPACTSLDTREIIAQFGRLADDPSFYASAGAAAERAFREELSHGVFRKRLMELVSKRPR